MLPGITLNRQKPKGYRQITVTNGAVVKLTDPGNMPSPLEVGVIAEAIVIIEDNTVRYRDDRTDPTTAIGMPVTAGTVLEIPDASFDSVGFIATAANAKLNVAYYG